MRAPSRPAYGGCARRGDGDIDTVGERLLAVRAQLEDELRACGRPAGAVTIVGVSKKQPLESIRAAIDAGLADVGENYVQEAVQKFAGLPPVRKHFIGHLQTNKAKAVAAAFDVVQSVDRIEAAAALSKAVAPGVTLSVLLQVNISPSERFGCPPSQAPALAEAVRALAGLRLDGVMAIGPVTEDRDEIFRAFDLAAKTLSLVGGSTLSIGMSGDWREAVRAGSTMIRLGTAIFGARGAA